MAWIPSKEYQDNAAELWRLRLSLRLLELGCYRWMHLPAIALIAQEIRELEKKQNNHNEKD